MRPRMDTARLALVTHEKITRSARTSPLTASTFSAPKNRSRAAMVSWLTPCPGAATTSETQPNTADSTKASAKKTRVIIRGLPFFWVTIRPRADEELPTTTQNYLIFCEYMEQRR